MPEIHRACKIGDLDLVKGLIQENRKLVNRQDYKKWTPLFYACAVNDVELVLYLLEMGAKVNLKDKKSMTPLHVAVTMKCGRIKKSVISCSIVKALLNAGADTDAKDTKDETPIFKIWESEDYVHSSLEWGIIELLAKGGAKFPDEDWVSNYQAHTCTFTRF